MLDHRPSKTHKANNHRPPAKPTNPATTDHQQNPQNHQPPTKQRHQQNTQTRTTDHWPSTKPTNLLAIPIHKPRTSDHRPLASTNSQTCQSHNDIFITSLLCGFVTILYRPPHNKPKTRNTNQNPQKSNTTTTKKKKPNSLSPIQTKTNLLQNPPIQHHYKEEERREIANPPPWHHRKDKERREIKNPPP